jgi:RNA polymerase sigma-70 factor (ECF subfamily)
MSSTTTFAELIERVRGGDETAAADLVRQYEPAIRRTIRLRMRDPRLRRVLDSLDVCQSVLASFFARAALGQYDLGTPDQLEKLLAAMARNKVIKQVERQHAARRDQRRETPGSSDIWQAPAPDPSPSKQVAGRELLEAFRARLTDEERSLVDLRASGREWPELAAQLGGSPEALRKKLARALDRVAQELNLDDADHE